MARPTNRSQLMEYLGAEQRNVVWSWCGVDMEDRKVYLSVWLDTAKKRDGARLSYIIQEPDWGIGVDGGVSPARQDHDEKLRLVFEHGFAPYGYFIEAKDQNARPRQIAETKTAFIYSLELERRSDGTILGYLKERISIR